MQDNSHVLAVPGVNAPLPEKKARAKPGTARKPYAERARTGSRLPPSKIGAALAMYQMGVPITEIAAREHMSKNTISSLVKQGDQTNPAIVDRVKKYLASHFYITAERSLQAITDEKLEKAGVSALAMVAGISTDKGLLLEGKPTARVEFKGSKDDALEDEINALEAEVEGWRDGTIRNAEPLGGVVGSTMSQSPSV